MTTLQQTEKVHSPHFTVCIPRLTLGGKNRFGSEVLIGLGSLGESLSKENLLMALHGQRVTCQGQEESGGLATALT